MSHDWISPEKAKSFPLRKFYVGLRWTKMVKGALKNYKQKLTSIYEILIAADTHMSKKNKCSRYSGNRYFRNIVNLSVT